MTKKSPLTPLYIREVPRAIRLAFKAWCTLRDVSMKDKLISMMKLSLEEEWQSYEKRTRLFPFISSRVNKDLLVKDFPRSLRNAFKAKCMLHHVSMRDKLILMMREVTKYTELPGATPGNPKKEDKE